MLCAGGVVVVNNPVHSAIFLVMSFFNVAGIFLMLGAEFLAVVQVIVYTGAILVLMLFVLMLVDPEASIPVVTLSLKTDPTTTIKLEAPKLTSYAFNIMLKGGFMYTTAGIGWTSVDVPGGVGESSEPTYNFGGGFEIGVGVISIDVSPRLFIINTADSASRKNLLIMAGANYYFF